MYLNCSRRLFLIFTGLFLVSPCAAAGIRVGLSQVDITPPVGGLTTGYASARPTDGIHDPVSARVLVLESDQARIALVVCDLCVYNSSWLHDQLPAIGVDQLLLLNTHTHAGPKLSQEDFPTADAPWSDGSAPVPCPQWIPRLGATGPPPQICLSIVVSCPHELRQVRIAPQ